MDLDTEQYDINQANLDVSQNSQMKNNQSKMSMRSTRSKWGKTKHPITLAEQREQQRIMETSHMGPGTHDTLLPIGHKVQGHISMGSKYEFKPDSNPKVGQYNIEAAHNYIKPKI